LPLAAKTSGTFQDCPKQTSAFPDGSPEARTSMCGCSTPVRNSQLALSPETNRSSNGFVTPLLSQQRHAPGSSPPSTLKFSASWCRSRFGFPSLSEAIRTDNVEGVRTALEDDPLAACRPLPDTQEYPIVAAVRCCCSLEVLAVLLQQGVDPDDMGADRITALEAVSRAQDVPPAVAGFDSPLFGPAWQKITTEWVSMPGAFLNFPRERMSEERCCSYAIWLLAFGADKSRLDAQGLSCRDHAQRNGRTQLADLLCHWGGVEARSLRALARSCVSAPSECCCRRRHTHGTATARHRCLLCLPSVVHDIVCDMLAPMPTLVARHGVRCLGETACANKAPRAVPGGEATSNTIV